MLCYEDLRDLKMRYGEQALKALGEILREIWWEG